MSSSAPVTEAPAAIRANALVGEAPPSPGGPAAEEAPVRPPAALPLPRALQTYGATPR